MIRHNKRTVEVPQLNGTYWGKHGETVIVVALSANIYGKKSRAERQRIIVEYIMPNARDAAYGPHAMELSRFMEWASDTPPTPPPKK